MEAASSLQSSLTVEHKGAGDDGEATSSPSKQQQQQQQPSQVATDTTASSKIMSQDAPPPSGVSLLRGDFIAAGAVNNSAHDDPTTTAPTTDRLLDSSASERSVSQHARMTATATSSTTTTPTNVRTIVSSSTFSPRTPADGVTDTDSSMTTPTTATDYLVYSDTEATEASLQHQQQQHTQHHPPHMPALQSQQQQQQQDAVAATTSTTRMIQADDTRMMALNFVMEHKIFLQAALLLLQERDKQAPEVGMLDPYIFKAGPLKKAAHLMNGVWKVKYVEIRRGMFSYYENNVDTSTATTTTTTNAAAAAATSTNADTTTGGGDDTTTNTTAAAAAAAAAAAENQTLLLQRKNIPLTASTCTCRPVKLHQKALNFTPLGAIFELSVAGNKRLWMANSREERQTWIQAIHHAMVGGSVTRGYYDGLQDDDKLTTTTTSRSATAAAAAMMGPSSSSSSQSLMRSNSSSLSNNKSSDWRKYNKTQQLLRNAKTMAEYVVGLRELLLQQSLYVPVKWIHKQMNSSSGGGGSSGGGSSSALITASSSGGGGGGGDGHRSPDGAATAFHEETIDMSVEQLWRDLQRDTVSIDGQVLRGDTGHGPERIVGALMRRILHVSRSKDSSTGSTGLPKSPLVTLSESQALAVTRDVLLAGNRTRTGGDSYFCINALCRNPDLVVIVPNARVADPVVYEVSEDQSDHSFHSRLISKSGWIKTRSRLNLSWKRRYFVLSEGTLSLYEGALPRPFGLRGQMFLKDAVLGLKRKDNSDGPNQQVILTISVSEGSAKKERLLLFESEERLIDWIYALECTAKSRYNAEAKKSQKQKRGKDTADTMMNQIGSFADIVTYAQLATFEHASTLGIHEDVVRARLERISRRTGSAIRISLRACTEYKICTTDPQGDEELDNWATIRTHFLQSFLATGGPNGRITRGEEMVRVSVVDCVAPPSSEQQLHDPPSTPRRPRNLRLFRGTSIEDPPAPPAAVENVIDAEANAEEQK